MRKVLMIAYYFPPIGATGAMRPLGFCRYLPQHGWAPQVVTTDPQSVYPKGPVDAKLTAKLPATVKVHVVPYVSPLEKLLHLRERVRRAIGWSHGDRVQSRGSSVQDAMSSNAKTPSTIGVVKRFMLDRLFSFPDPQSSWMRPVLREMGRLGEEDRPDVIFATGSPWTSMLIGRELGRRFQVPYVVDFRDPWAMNAGFHYLSPRLVRMTQALEREVCNEAGAVIANTEELKDHLVQQYPAIQAKCVALPNGFHADDFSGRSATVGGDGISDSGLELCHFGTMYMMRTPKELLRALLELVEQGALSKPQLIVRFVGGWDIRDPQSECMALELEKQGVLRREPPVSHQECLNQMSKADALLAMQPGSPLQIPAKIYEYIATRRPLVVIGDSGATFNLVRRHKLGICCPNNVQAIKQLLKDLIRDPGRIASPAEESSDAFNYCKLSDRLAGVLDRAYDSMKRGST